MKRLVISLAVFLSLMVLPATAFAAARFWKVEIFEPTASTVNRSLNVEYKVSSTVKDDDFTVELFENGASKGTQEVTHEWGDSGVFSVNMPSNGTYSYKVAATNHGADDSTKDSNTVTVQVVNGPEPAVITVPATTTAVGGAAGGSTQGATSTNQQQGNQGKVGQNGASTEKKQGDKKDVLGSETKGNKRSWWSNAAIILAIVIVLLAAYLFLTGKQLTAISSLFRRK